MLTRHGMGPVPQKEVGSAERATLSSLKSQMWLLQRDCCAMRISDHVVAFPTKSSRPNERNFCRETKELPSEQVTTALTT